MVAVVQPAGVTAPTAGTLAWSATLAPAFTNAQPLLLLTMTGNSTMSAPTLPVGSFAMRIAQDSTGTRIMTWPSSLVWPGGIKGVLSTAPSAVDVLTLVSFDGATATAVLNKGVA